MVTVVSPVSLVLVILVHLHPLDEFAVDIQYDDTPLKVSVNLIFIFLAFVYLTAPCLTFGTWDL